MFCQKCGKPVNPAPSFCRECGKPINPEAKFCQTCGKPASSDAALCGDCRKAATPHPVSCERCKNIVSPDSKFCQFCGVPVSAQQQSFEAESNSLPIEPTFNIPEVAAKSKPQAAPQPQVVQVKQAAPQVAPPSLPKPKGGKMLVAILSILLCASLTANVFLGINVVNNNSTTVKEEAADEKKDTDKAEDNGSDKGESNNSSSGKEENKKPSSSTNSGSYELSGAAQTLMNTDNYAHEKYGFEIVSARIDKNYDNKPVVVVTYSFTNNTDTATYFYYDLKDGAFQNGVALEETYFLSNDRDLKGDRLGNVMPGYTAEFEMAYVLADTTTDIEVYIMSDYHNTILAKRTFAMN